MKVYKIALFSPREHKIDSLLSCKFMGAEEFKSVFLPAVWRECICKSAAGSTCNPLAARLSLLPFGRILIVRDGTVTGLKEKFWSFSLRQVVIKWQCTFPVFFTICPLCYSFSHTDFLNSNKSAWLKATLPTSLHILWTQLVIISVNQVVMFVWS